MFSNPFIGDTCHESVYIKNKNNNNKNSIAIFTTLYYYTGRVYRERCSHLEVHYDTYIYTVLVLGIKYNIILYSGVHANATTTTAATAVDSIISPGNLLSLAYDPPPSPLASDNHRPLTFSRPLSLYRNNIHAYLHRYSRTHITCIYIFHI